MDFFGTGETTKGFCEKKIFTKAEKNPQISAQRGSYDRVSKEFDRQENLTV
jgi:hypothetical protein